MKLAFLATVAIAQTSGPQCLLDSDCASQVDVASTVCCARLAYQTQEASAVERTCVSISLLQDAASSGNAYVYQGVTTTSAYCDSASALTVALVSLTAMFLNLN